MSDQSPPPPPPQQFSSQVPPTPPPPAQPAKKGLSPLAWVGIGCGCLLVLACIVMLAGGVFVFNKGRDALRNIEDDPAMAAAETVVRINPELELVASDREADTLTVRNKRTGEEMTLDLADVQQGKIGFRSAEGETSLEMGGAEGEGVLSVKKDGQETFRLGGGAAADLPEWLPSYPGTEAAGLYSSREGGVASGAATITTPDAAADVLSWYRERLEEAGFEVRRSDVSGTGGEGVAGTLQAEAPDGRTVGVMALRTGSETRATVSYEGPEG